MSEPNPLILQAIQDYIDSKKLVSFLPNHLESYKFYLMSCASPQITSLLITSDNNFIVVGSVSSYITIWSLQFHNILQILYSDSGSINSMCLDSSSPIVYFSSADLTLCSWAFLESPSSILLYTSTELITKVEECSKVALLICCTLKGSLIIFSLKTLDVQTSIKAHSSWITCLIVSLSTDQFITGSEDGQIRIWNFSGGLHSSKSHKLGVTSLALSPTSKFLSSGSYDCTVSVISLETGKVITKFCENSKGIIALEYLKEDIIVIGTLDLQVKVVDLGTGIILKSWKNLSRVHQFIVVNEEFVGLCSNGEVFCVGIEELEEVFRCRLFDRGFESGALSRNLKKIVGFSGDEFGVLDMNDKKVLGVFKGHTSELSSILLIPSTHYLVTGSADTTIKIWDIYHTYQVCTLKKHQKPVYALDFCESTQKIISKSDDSICFWSLSTFTLDFHLPTKKSSKDLTSFSKDKKIFLHFTNLKYDIVNLIHLDQKTTHKKIFIDIEDVSSIAVSKLNNFFAVSSEDLTYIFKIRSKNNP